MRQLLLAAVAMVLGVFAATSCGAVKMTGPTALVLEVYFSEARGAKALVISGTAEVDGVPVNVFPTSQRPEQLTGAAFPVPQTVRILLNDSRAGIPLQLTVIGINADGDPVEAATQTVTPVAQAETLVTITLKPFTDTVEPDGGVVPDGGVTTFDAGAPDAGVRCSCATGCCDSSGRCASPISLQLGSRTMLTIVLSGRTGEFCNGICSPGKASQFANNTCLCGSTPACGDGVRCQGQTTSGRCVCDTSSGCRGCCANGACDTGRALLCGSAGNQCTRCEGTGNVCQLTGRCSVNMCPPPSSSSQGQCCSGSGPVTAQFPTCASATGDCVACDVLRSSTCRAVAVGSLGQPCGCGTGAQCASNQLCLFQNGAAACVTVN